MKEESAQMPPGRLSLPRLLLICGSGRNSGKTLIATRIINSRSQRFSVAAIKISMHNHEHHERMKILEKGKGYQIWQDNGITRKDSGRFLEAGAAISLYTETTDEYLFEAFTRLITHIPEEALIVCESGGLSRFIKPGLMIFVHEMDIAVPGNKIETMLQSDLVLCLDQINDDLTLQSISVKDGGWALI